MMKSIQGQIMYWFVLISVALLFAVIPLDLFSGWLLESIGERFSLPYDISFSEMPRNAQLMVSGILICWGGATILLYVGGIYFFGKKILKKIMRPVDEIVNGLSSITGGNLTQRLDFDAENEFLVMRDSFNQMAERLEQTEQGKKQLELERMQLFSNIAHDLKTPVTTIAGYAGALVDDVVDGPDKQKQYLRSIKHKALHVNQMIEQLFDYSKMETRDYKLNKSDTDVAELTRLACAQLFGDFEEQQMELILEILEKPLMATIDRMELSRAVNNLLINAINHNPTGTIVRVEMSESEEAFQICISDNGSPIPTEIRETLFEPFVLGDVSRNSKNGSGLGLSIVKKIVMLHQGSITLVTPSSPYSKKFILEIPK